MSTTRLLRWVAANLMLGSGGYPTARGAPDTRAPWLVLPSGWGRAAVNGVVVAIPADLPRGAELLLTVDPVRALPATSLETEYDRAVTDLGGWSPRGTPTSLGVRGAGWTFRRGAGVARLDGKSYAALTAVALHDSLRARFWVLADVEDTYDRYEPALSNAIASVGGYRAPAAQPPTRRLVGE